MVTVVMFTNLAIERGPCILRCLISLILHEWVGWEITKQPSPICLRLPRASCSSTIILTEHGTAIVDKTADKTRNWFHIRSSCSKGLLRSHMIAWLSHGLTPSTKIRAWLQPLHCYIHSFDWDCLGLGLGLGHGKDVASPLVSPKNPKRTTIRRWVFYIL